MELDLSYAMPYKYDVNAVEGMMENPLLTGVLEQMVSVPGLAARVRPGEVWYQDAHFTVAGMSPPMVEIRDVMACSLNQAKLILAHFPHALLRVVAPGEPYVELVMPRLHVLARCAARPFQVAWPMNNGLEFAGKFPAPRLSLKLQQRFQHAF